VSATLAQLMELTTHCSECAPARSSRSPLARPLPYVHRTIGERNFTEPLALLAQLMDLASYCRDCGRVLFGSRVAKRVAEGTVHTKHQELKQARK